MVPSYVGHMSQTDAQQVGAPRDNRVKKKQYPVSTDVQPNKEIPKSESEQIHPQNQGQKIFFEETLKVILRPISKRVL